VKKEYVEYNAARGHPSGAGLFYECVLCGGMVSSLAVPKYEDCPCGNLHKEPGRLGTNMGDTGMRLVRITDAESDQR
jgi:hypothetical protein